MDGCWDDDGGQSSLGRPPKNIIEPERKVKGIKRVEPYIYEMNEILNQARKRGLSSVGRAFA